MVIAGDTDLAGDIQWYRWVRNNHAHPMDLLSTAATALNAGEPERTTKADTAKRQNAKRELRATFKRVPKLKLRNMHSSGCQQLKD